MRRNTTAALVGLAALTAASLNIAGAAMQQETDWSRFRGPNGSGTADVSDLPVEFGPERGLIWSQTIPAGKSSPVLGARHVFVTAVEAGQLVVLAFDRATGEQAWRVAVDPGFELDMYPANDGASPTPTTDGENVFVVFGTFGVLALNGEGEEMWRMPVEPIDTFYGLAASPILAGDTLIALFDQRSGSFVLGLDRLTGAVRWRRERLARVGSWTTPVLYPPQGPPEQVLISGSTWLDAYAIETGEPFWELDGFGYWPVASPTVIDGFLVAAAPDQAGDAPETFAAVLAAGDGDDDGLMSEAELFGLERFAGWVGHFGQGDLDGDGHWNEAEYASVFLASVTDEYGAVGVRIPAPDTDGRPEIVWRDQRAVPYHVSPLVLDEFVFLIADNGIISVLERATGELVRRERLSRSGVNVTASPVFGDGKIYVATADGEIHVLSAGSDWEILATNDLGEPMYATPALAPGRIFVRTDGHLYAFGAEPY